jgi:recombination protein RecA
MAKKKADSTPKAVKLPSDMPERLLALEVAQAKLDKEIGKGAVMCMGKQPEMSDVEVIHTGSVGLDYALGVGGLPRGRVVEIFGPESSGKTTLAMHVIVEAQKEGGLAAIIDAEHAFDRAYAEALGVDINRLWIAQPDNGEQALDIADQLINSGAIDVMVIDSVAALTPKAEIDGSMGDRNMGLQARLMSQALRKLTSTISKTRTCCIFINQLREKIGVFMGNPEVTTGGNALKFYSSVRLEIRGSTLIKGPKDTPVGRVAKVKVLKNKVAPPFTRCEFDIIFGKGISKAGEVLDMAAEQGIVKKSGSWYAYGDSKLGQGRDAVRDMLEDNPELLAELEEKVRQNLWASKNDDKDDDGPHIEIVNEEIDQSKPDDDFYVED